MHLVVVIHYVAILSTGIDVFLMGIEQEELGSHCTLGF